MKRRELLEMGAGVLLTAGLWPGQLEAAPQTLGQGEQTWRFLVVNDLHFQQEACRPWFDRVVATMKQSAPDAQFCLVCGDLADEGKEVQVRGVKEAFAALGVPVHVTPGNHDYATDIDSGGFDSIYPGPRNSSFEVNGWQFVGLDTTDGTRWQNTSIHQPTFEWVEQNLPQLSRTKPTVIYTHFPLGFGAKNRPLNADALLEKFLDFNVQAVLSGHWHGYSLTPFHAMQCITNRCCSRVRDNHDGTTEKGWFVCEVQGGRMTKQFVEIPALLKA